MIVQDIQVCRQRRYAAFAMIHIRSSESNAQCLPSDARPINTQMQNTQPPLLLHSARNSSIGKISTRTAIMVSTVPNIQAFHQTYPLNASNANSAVSFLPASVYTPCVAF